MRRNKKKATFRWGGDWIVVWVLGGFALTYFAYIPITGDKVHPLHWLFSILGGVAAYGIGLFVDMGLPSVVRFVRHSPRRMTWKPDREKQAKRRS